MTSPRQPGSAGGADLRWQQRRVFLVGLTAAAGWLDALAFLHLGKVFISFMSGNLLFVGTGAGNGDGGLVVRAGAVLGAFLAGIATLALLVVGAAAMGVRAAIALAFHLPNVATVAMTVTLAQLGALAGWREREGRSIVAKTPTVSLMIPVCLAYLISAIVVAAAPETPAMAFGPLLLLGSAIATDALLAPRGSLAAVHARG